MYLLERQIVIPASRAEVFAFFEDPRNLAKITPRWLPIDDLTAGYPPMHEGMQIVHPIRWCGVRLAWESRIAEYDPPRRFVDEQIRGPYRFWRHEHDFENVAEGTLMRDRVQYDLPFSILGRVIHSVIVKRQLRAIFDYRELRVRELFPTHSVAHKERAKDPSA